MGFEGLSGEVKDKFLVFYQYVVLYNTTSPPSLLKLQEALRGLSSADSDIGFAEYLDSYGEYWDYAHAFERTSLTEILIEHTTSHSQFYPQTETHSPIIRSSAGIKLISFVDNKLSTFEDFGQSFVTEWRKVLNKIFIRSLEELKAVVDDSHSVGDGIDAGSAKSLIPILEHGWNWISTTRNGKRRLVQLYPFPDPDPVPFPDTPPPPLRT
ncbi:hypothetical protein PQX77_018155 [Marasmius sp. AFHP31]|nr:hypothetical protein PQX77_018155 [Marasmius sp. AFHP31]